MSHTPINFASYLGLYAALLLSVACDAFLDIQYGSFTGEMTFWAIVFGCTLFIGWLQSRKAIPPCTAWQKIVSVFGIFLFLVVFLRLWGMPRAGLYFLAMMQASSNCVTVTRKQLNLGLLASLTLVMFAASHYRANWTLLFYLLPYLIAVVFTLVAEQIHCRNNDLQQISLGTPSKQGQGAAIAAATASILVIGLGLYLMTPQVNWPYLEWRYGQVVPGNSSDKSELEVSSGQKDRQLQGKENSGDQQSSPQSHGNPELFPGSRWPTPAEMRAAAKYRFMPDWQAAMIEKAADLNESFQQTLSPVIVRSIDFWEALKRWLKEHLRAIVFSLLGLILLAIFFAFSVLLKEIQWVVWLMVQWDYLRLVVFARHENGGCGARQYYQAMSRLFALQDVPRPATANTREYLEQIVSNQRELHKPATELTGLFEKARYSSETFDNNNLIRMQQLYRDIYRNLE